MSLYAGKPRNIDKIKQKISSLPHGLRGVATEGAAEYIVGDNAHGLQHYAPPRPKSKYKRTYELRFGWKVKNWGDGTRVKITNDVAYSPYVQGDDSQAWMHKGRWRTVSEVVSTNIKGAIRHAQSVVNKFIKSKG